MVLGDVFLVSWRFCLVWRFVGFICRIVDWFDFYCCLWVIVTLGLTVV